MTLARTSITRFLNVDLDVRAHSGLGELLGPLASSVLVLNQSAQEASVELNEQHDSLEETIVKLIELIQSLPPQAEAIWNKCELRRFNIGIEAELEPYATCFTLSNQTISLLAGIKAEIMFTVYAPSSRAESLSKRHSLA
jgi:hypothetical protein